METLDEFDVYLKNKGYTKTKVPYDFIDTILNSVDYIKNNHIVTLFVEGTEEFWKELKENGTKEFSVSDYNVNSIFIESPVTNIADFFTGEKTGIRLVNKVTPESYVKHDFSLLEYCLGLQKVDLISHEKKILGCHLKNLEYIERYKKFLEDHDYKIDYSSIFDVSENYERESSDLSIIFLHYSGESLYFETDCLTGVLKLNDRPLKDNTDLEKYIEENYWIDSKTIPYSKYNYFYDSSETKDSYSETIEFLQAYQHKIRGKEFNHLPQKYKEEYENYRNENFFRDKF